MTNDERPRNHDASDVTLIPSDSSQFLQQIEEQEQEGNAAVNSAAVVGVGPLFDRDQELELEQELNGSENFAYVSGAGGQNGSPALVYRAKNLMRMMKLHGKQEAFDTLFLCWPILIASVCGTLLGTTDIAFIGRLGKDELAAAAFANTIFFALSFIPVGFLGAQDTLISQSAGAGNDRARKAIVLRSLFLMTVITIPIVVALMFIEPVLLLLGQKKEIAQLTNQFLRWLALSLWPYVIMRLVSRYLTAQKLVYFPMFASIFSVFLNAGLNYLMIYGVFGVGGMGFIGAPIATICTRMFILSSYTVYALYIERKKWKQAREQGEESNVALNNEQAVDEPNENGQTSNRGGRNLVASITHLSKIVLHPRGLFEYIKLGIPAAAGLCLEVWGFDITTIIAGLLANNAYLGAHAIILNICVITFMLPLSVSIASSIRIGMSLGAGEADRAKIASVVGFFICLLIMVGNATFMLVTRHFIGRLFTNNAEIIGIVSSVIPIAAMFQIFDGAQVALGGGILRATGKQGIGAIANLISYYVIALPLGALLCFYFKLQLSGLWYGLFIALFSVSILLLLYAVFAIDFHREVINAQERVKRSDVIGEEEKDKKDKTTSIVDEQSSGVAIAREEELEEYTSSTLVQKEEEEEEV